MVEPIIKISGSNFDETVTLIEELLELEGFVLMASKNIDEVIKAKLGIENYSRYTIILACKPELAKGALDISKISGFLFPCSFVVYEDDEKVKIGHISIMRIIPDIGLAPYEKMEPVIKETAGDINRIWEKL